MNKKVKTTKFKVINAKINKKLVGEEFDLQKIKPKSGTNNTTPTKKQKSTSDLLIEFMTEQRTFNKFVTQKFAEQTMFNKQQIEFNTRIEKEVLNLSTRIDNLVKVNNLKE